MGARRPVRRPGADVLSRRALNHAALERQLLLRRADLPVVAAVERVLGLNAQSACVFAGWSNPGPIVILVATGRRRNGRFG